MTTTRDPAAGPRRQEGTPPHVAILADDLIWATRLARLVEAAGGHPVPVRTASAFADALATADRAIVDLTARAYDGVEQVASAAASGCPVVAVGQHDDRELRGRATAAGARRVHPYRVLSERGSAVLERWFAEAVP